MDINDNESQCEIYPRDPLQCTKSPHVSGDEIDFDKISQQKDSIGNDALHLLGHILLLSESDFEEEKIHKTNGRRKLPKFKPKIKYVTKSFPCSVCRKVFDHKFKLTRHMKRTHAEKACKICNKKFNVLWRLRNHLKRIHSIEQMKCLHCKKFALNDLCKTCKGLFKVPRVVISKLHSSLKLNCFNCREMNNQELCRKCADVFHAKVCIHRGFPCDNCSKLFESHTNLFNHNCPMYPNHS